MNKETIRVAAVQMDVALMKPEENLSAIEQALEEAAGKGARLVVFPECAVTGYCFESLEEALPLGESIPGPSSDRIGAACARLDVHGVFGLLERVEDRLYNACVLVGPAGLVSSYRKIHLPFLGIDRFVTPGDRPFAVHEAARSVMIRAKFSSCRSGSLSSAVSISPLATRLATPALSPCNCRKCPCPPVQ